MKENKTRWTVNGNDYNPDLNKKPTENLEQLMKRFTKRLKQIESKEAQTTAEYDKINEQVHYLRGCIDVVEYLMTGKLPSDGNHDGMKPHKPNKSSLTFQEKVIFTPKDQH